MPEQIEYDEFAMFHENASEFGLPFDGPPAVRRESVDVGGRTMSALVWGSSPPVAMLIHGGAQNAHTWDTVAMALDQPLVAVDLPGHGHSDGPDPDLERGTLTAEGNAADVAAVADALIPAPDVVAGMSLGGLTSIALAAARPDLVKRLVLVDITPGVSRERSQAISNFVNGPRTFPSFDDLLARTIEHNPTRSESSLRRGILHNALQEADGSWVWRYRRDDGTGLPVGSQQGMDAPPDYEPLWQALADATAPVVLVRGMRPQSVVGDDDVAELMKRRPDAEVIEVAEAGHSVQGDTPLELADILRDVAARPLR